MRADVDKFCSHSGDARYDELDANKDGKLHESEVRRKLALLLTIFMQKGRILLSSFGPQMHMEETT